MMALSDSEVERNLHLLEKDRRADLRELRREAVGHDRCYRDGT